MVGHLTLLVTLAGEPGAGVDTLLGQGVAGSGERTALVTPAATSAGLGGWASVTGRVRPTGGVRSPNVALRTLTAWSVQHHRADGILTTGSPQTARVNTLTSSAGLAGRTVEISLALTI